MPFETNWSRFAVYLLENTSMERSNKTMNGWSSIGKVTAMPINPTTNVIGNPTAKMFICGATLETMPNAKLTNINMPTIGSAIHNALANKSDPSL